MFSYRKIFKQAWALAKQHKFLWVYGLLLFLGQVFNGIYLGFNRTQEAQNGLANFQNYEWAGWGIVVLVCAWLLIYFRARAGIILAIKSLSEQEKIKPLVSFYFGRFFVSRLLGLMIILQLSSLILSLIVSTPIYYLLSLGLSTRAIILGGLAVMVVVPVLFVLNFLNILAPLFIVIFDMPLREAFWATINLIASFWKRLLAVALLLMLGWILVLLAGSVVAAPLVILATLSYHSGGTLSFILSVIGSSIIFLALGSVFEAFRVAVWMKVFGELVLPQKWETKEEAEAVSEAVE